MTSETNPFPVLVELAMQLRPLLALALCALSISAFGQEMPPAKDMVLGKRLFIAFGKKVREELKVTEAQFQKMQDAFEGTVQIEEDRIMVSMGPDMDMEGMEKKALKVLEEPQVKRLDEIWLQMTGAIAAADEKIGKALALTEEQKKSVNAIVEDTAKELADLFMGGHDESVPKKAKTLKGKASDKVILLLTADQKKTFETLKGKPFKLEPDKS